MIKAIKLLAKVWQNIKNKLKKCEEVKLSENINNVSLTRFNESNENKISVRFSARNLDKSGKILNIPIFIAEYIDKLITLGME